MRVVSDENGLVVLVVDVQQFHLALSLKDQLELSPLPHRTCNIDRTAHLLYDLLANGEPEACAL